MNIAKNMYFGGTKANTAAMKTRNRATFSVACICNKFRRDSRGDWRSDESNQFGLKIIQAINHKSFNNCTQNGLAKCSIVKQQIMIPIIAYIFKKNCFGPTTCTTIEIFFEVDYKYPPVVI